MVAWKEWVSVSNGSACTSHRYEPSYVLTAMGLSAEAIQGAVRLSWGWERTDVEWGQVASWTAAIGGLPLADVLYRSNAKAR